MGTILEAVAIRSKVYALKVQSHGHSEEQLPEEFKRMKGIRCPIVKERIKFSDYVDALYGKPLFVTFQKIASKNIVCLL